MPRKRRKKRNKGVFFSFFSIYFHTFARFWDGKVNDLNDTGRCRWDISNEQKSSLKENPNLDEILDVRQDNKYYLFFLDERNYENSSIA